MGLTAGVAIVTAAQVAAITHEALLANLDAGADATLANAAAEATNELIRRVRARGADPAALDADTVAELRAAAAFYALFSVFASMPQDEENGKKAASYKARFEEQLRYVTLRTTTANALTLPAYGVPVVVNRDAGSILPGLDVRAGFPERGPWGER